MKNKTDRQILMDVFDGKTTGAIVVVTEKNGLLNSLLKLQDGDDFKACDLAAISGFELINSCRGKEPNNFLIATAQGLIDDFMKKHKKENQNESRNLT